MMPLDTLRHYFQYLAGFRHYDTPIVAFQSHYAAIFIFIADISPPPTSLRRHYAFDSMIAARLRHFIATPAAS